MITFICEKKYIDENSNEKIFTINQLKIFTKLLIDAIVIVPNIGKIQDGEIDYFKEGKNEIKRINKKST